MVEAAPDTTIDQFKDLVLQTLRAGDDELTRKVTAVQLVLTEEELPDTSDTLKNSGVSADADLLAVFSTRSVECVEQTGAPYDLRADHKHVVLNIPFGTVEIGRNAFSGCRSIQSLMIPASVRGISEGAFRGCTSLMSLTLPDSVDDIGVDSFTGCSSLRSVTISHSITRIRDGAFSGCSSLMSLTIPSSVDSIGVDAFNGCSSLTSVEMPNSVTRIGSRAFIGCSSLTSLEVPDTVISIGAEAFKDCSSLRSLTLPQIYLDAVFSTLPTACEVTFVEPSWKKDEKDENGCLRAGLCSPKEQTVPGTHDANHCALRTSQSHNVLAFMCL